jgi:hypothetical protein
MSEVIVFPEGGYRYIKSVFQYSAGVAAEPGFAIERVRLARPLPLADGFAAVEAHLKSVARPTVAFCACELRSPKPFTPDTFYEFNREYVKTLERWGVYRDEKNPVARTNVIPAHDPPQVASLYAFAYTVRALEGTPRSFITAGGGELRDGPARFEHRIVCFRDTSINGLREKMRHVMKEMERRLSALGFSWADAVSTQVYTVRDIGPLIEDEIVRRGATPGGLTWHLCRPPVINVEYEMDVRGTAFERRV